MLFKNFLIELDISKEIQLSPIRFKESDTGSIVFQFIFKNRGYLLDLENHTITLCITTPSGIYKEMQIDKVFNLTTDLMTELGEYNCEIVISYMQKQVTTQQFYYIVENSTVRLRPDSTKRAVCGLFRAGELLVGQNVSHYTDENDEIKITFLKNRKNRIK